MRLREIRHLIGEVLLPTLSRTRLLFGLLGVVVLLATYVFTPVPDAERIVTHGGYWFTMFTLVGFGYYAFRLRSVVFTWFASLDRGTLMLLILAWLGGGALLFNHAHFGPKVMMDDAVLESTARSLHQERQVYVTDYGRTIESLFVPFDGYVDKRPWLYPFAVSILHDASGYRVANAYTVNAVAGFVFLGLMLVMGYQLARLRGAILLMLLWLTIPLFAQNATGSGMDMLNLFMLGIVMLASVVYLKRPSHGTEGALSLAGVLLAYGRYESVLFCVLVFAVITVGWIRSQRIWLSAGSICAAPLLVGLVLQQKFFSASEGLWELHSGTVSPFGFEHFNINLARALNFFFDTGDQIGNSFLVAILGGISLLLMLLFLLKHSGQISKAEPVKWVIALMSIFLLVHMAVILCYHDGALDRLFASRFALPFYLLLTCNTVLCLRALECTKFVWNLVFGVTALFLCMVTFPMNAKGVFTHRNYVVKELEWMERIIKSEVQERALLVDHYGIYWALRDQSALSSRIVMISDERIASEVSEGKFSEIIVVDRRDLSIDESGVTLAPLNFESDHFDLELIAEASFKPFELTQIYRVTNVKPFFRGDQ